MTTTESMAQYNKIKWWGPVDKSRAMFSGEVGMRGALVCERYLDDTSNRLGCRLKLLCRSNRLPTLSRIFSEEGINPSWAVCLQCHAKEIESIEHILLRCARYERYRRRLFEAATLCSLDKDEKFEDMEDLSKTQFILGGRASSRAREDWMDSAVKRFLARAWRSRRRCTSLVNEKFGRHDLVDLVDAPKAPMDISQARLLLSNYKSRQTLF